MHKKHSLTSFQSNSFTLDLFSQLQIFLFKEKYFKSNWKKQLLWNQLPVIIHLKKKYISEVQLNHSWGFLSCSLHNAWKPFFPQLLKHTTPNCNLWITSRCHKHFPILNNTDYTEIAVTPADNPCNSRRCLKWQAGQQVGCRARCGRDDTLKTASQPAQKPSNGMPASAAHKPLDKMLPLPASLPSPASPMWIQAWSVNSALTTDRNQTWGLFG